MVSNSAKAQKTAASTPIGALLIEHRLIERMLRILDREAAAIDAHKQATAGVFENAVDFFKSYADQCHHGKEEDIFFRDLCKKPMSPEHGKVLNELIAEHVQGRELVNTLGALDAKYVQSGAAVLPEIAALIRTLSGFYKAHIEKEDKRFFIPALKYFTQEEQAQMLERFHEFDRCLIHERYIKAVARLE